MSEYTPTVWRTGDVITAEKLNKIEEGIANAEGGGESDFSVAEVTITAGEGGIAGYLLYLPILESDGLSTVTEISLEAQEQITKTIVLYKGKTVVGGFGFYSVDSTTGDITIDPHDWYIITGDCSITLSQID